MILTPTLLGRYAETLPPLERNYLSALASQLYSAKTAGNMLARGVEPWFQQFDRQARQLDATCIRARRSELEASWTRPSVSSTRRVARIISDAEAAVLVAFADPAGVPPGWRFEPAGDQNDDPSWILDHESGLRIEVYPPAHPVPYNRPTWQVRAPSGRIVAWNVAESRNAAFVDALPRRA